MRPVCRRSARLDHRQVVRARRVNLGLLQRSRLGHLQPDGGPDLGAGLPEAIAQLQLDHVDAHRGEGQPEDQVQNAAHHVDRMLRHKVTEADRRDGDEHKVERLEEGPVLPGVVDRSPEQHVRDQDEDRDRDGQVELVVDLERLRLGRGR